MSRTFFDRTSRYMKNIFRENDSLSQYRLFCGLLARMTLVHEFASDAQHRENSSMKVIITHPGQRGAYNKGLQAKRDGLPRTPPYVGQWRSKYAMERAWLMGYDAATAKIKKRRGGWKKNVQPCEFHEAAISLPDEVWHPVVGWERYYRVSSLGRVYSLHQTGRLVTGMHVRDGYHVVKTRDGERRGNLLVHHMVLEAFVGPRPPGAQGCHCNGNPGDDRATNLRWDTPQANQNDRLQHGTSIRGRSTPRLPEDAIRQIRATPEITAAEWASRLGVTPTTVFNARRGRTWRRVA